MLFHRRQMEENKNLVDNPNPRERDEDAANAIDQHVSAKDGSRVHRAISNATQSQRNERHDNEGVKDYGGEYRGMRACAIR